MASSSLFRVEGWSGGIYLAGNQGGQNVRLQLKGRAAFDRRKHVEGILGRTGEAMSRSPVGNRVRRVCRVGPRNGPATGLESGSRGYRFLRTGREPLARMEAEP